MDVRLHSGIGCVTPQAQPEGHDPQIVAERSRKLVAARQAGETAHYQPQPEHQTPVPVVAWQNGAILHLTLNHYTSAHAQVS